MLISKLGTPTSIAALICDTDLSRVTTTVSTLHPDPAVGLMPCAEVNTAEAIRVDLQREIVIEQQTLFNQFGAII